jgi:hypothetical protein
MTVREHRFSSIVLEAPWLEADSRARYLAEDYEAGPKAIQDVSEGLDYQIWQMRWEHLTSTFVLTPETFGAPISFHTAPLVDHCSFCFDQNGNATLVYRTAGSYELYWFDTNINGYTITAYPEFTSAMLSLDDKRQTQTNSSDMLLWYTIQQPDLSYNLYNREQRDRFLNAYLFAENTPPYIYKAGMNTQLRGQLELRYSAGA